MDYSQGTELAKIQWDATRNPGHVIGLFQKDKSGMFAGGYVFTPDYKITHISGSTTVIVDPSNKESLKTGTLPGFEITENGVVNRYIWKNGVYVLYDYDKQEYIYSRTYKLPEQNYLREKESTIYLFYNLENTCGGQAYIQTTYAGEIAALVDNINKNNVQDKTKAFIEIINALKAKSSLLPCQGTKEDINENAWKVSNIPVNCGASDIRLSLAVQLENIGKITDGMSPENVFNILNANYSPCLINLLDIEKRILIINKIIDNDKYWKIGDSDVLSELIQTTPASDRVILLKKGVMENKYKWLKKIFDDGNSSMVHNLFTTLNKWVIKDYSNLGIQPTSKTGITQLYDNGQWVQKAVKYFPGSEPYYIGIRSDNPLTSGHYTINGYSRNFDVEFRNDSIYFRQSYYYSDNSANVTAYGSDNPNATLEISTEYTLSPFEPINVIIGKNYGDLNLTAGELHTSTAFLAMLLYKDVKDDIVKTEIRKVADGIAIGAGVLATIPSGGSSLEAAVSIVAMVNGLASVYDIVQLNARDNLTPAEYNENREFYEAWDNFKVVLDVSDLAVGGVLGIKAIANSPIVIRYWDNLVYWGTKQSGKLSGKALDLWNILKTGGNLFDINTVKSLSAVTPNGKNLTRIILKDLRQDEFLIIPKPSSGKLAEKISDVMRNGDPKGNITEEIFDELMASKGYQKIDAKYYGVNGFDGCYIPKGQTFENASEIIISESKQLKQGKLVEFDEIAKTNYDEASGLVLNSPNKATGLPAQMSDEWIRFVIDKLRDSGKREIADMISNNRNILSKYINTIDKSDGNIVVIKLANY
jgi:hypothetical protein